MDPKSAPPTPDKTGGVIDETVAPVPQNPSGGMVGEGGGSGGGAASPGEDAREGGMIGEG
jgi:hypothetical protein